MLYAVLWNGIGFICLAALIELAGLALRNLRGASVWGIFGGIFAGLAASGAAAGALLYLALYTDYYAFFIERASPVLRLLLLPLTLLFLTVVLSFIVGRVFTRPQLRAVSVHTALFFSTAAILYPIGVSWVEKGMVLAEKYLA